MKNLQLGTKQEPQRLQCFCLPGVDLHIDVLAIRFLRDDEVRDAFGFSLLPVYFLLEHA